MKIDTTDLEYVPITDHVEIPGVPCPECGFGLTVSEAAFGDCDNCGAELELEVRAVSSGGEG